VAGVSLQCSSGVLLARLATPFSCVASPHHPDAHPPTRPIYPIRPSPSRRATHLRSYCTLFLGCRDQRFAKPEAPYETDLGCGVHEGWNEGRNWTSNNLSDECIFGADCGGGGDFRVSVASRCAPAGGARAGDTAAKRRTDREAFGFYVPRRCWCVLYEKNFRKRGWNLLSEVACGRVVSIGPRDWTARSTGSRDRRGAGAREGPPADRWRGGRFWRRVKQ